MEIDETEQEEWDLPYIEFERMDVPEYMRRKGHDVKRVLGSGQDRTENGK